jgi:hypothetical protein
MAHPKLEAPRHKVATRKVGFYGCNGAVVRLEIRAKRAPRSVPLEECPGCKHGHTVHPFWRVWRKDIDSGKEALAVTHVEA